MKYRLGSDTTFAEKFLDNAVPVRMRDVVPLGEYSPLFARLTRRCHSDLVTVGVGRLIKRSNAVRILLRKLPNVTQTSREASGFSNMVHI